MDLTDPAGSVVPSLDREVFAVLAGTNSPLTGREIHRLARRGSQTGIQRVLTALSVSGLATVTDAGSARIYTLNRDHVAADAVLALLDLRGKLFARIRDELREWPIPPVAAAIFGSAARGDGDQRSDIDLFLIRPQDLDADDPPWASQLDQLSDHVTRWSGNPASFIQADPTQVRAMIDRGESIIDDLRRDAIPLTDRHVLDLTAAAR